MFSFFKRREPAKVKIVNHWSCAVVKDHLRGTPAALLDLAQMFRKQGLHQEAGEVAHLAVLLLLRMRYLLAYQKNHSTCSDIGSLIRKLQQRDVITMDQWQFACDLYSEAQNLAFAKQARKFMQLGDYLQSILQK